MGRLGRAATGNDGTKEIKQSYSITSVRSLLIKIASWLRLVGVSI